MHYRDLGARAAQTPQSEPIPGKQMIPNNAGGFAFAADDLLQLKRFLILGTVGGTYYVGERKLTKQNLEVVERLLKAGAGRQVVDLVVEISQAGRAASNDPALFALARCAACDVRGQVAINIPEKRTKYVIPEGRAMRTVREPGGEKRELADGETTTRANGLVITRSGRVIEEYRPARSGVLIPHSEDIEVRQYALANLWKVARTGTHLLHFAGLVKQFRGWGQAYKNAMAGWYNAKRQEKLAYQLLKYQSRDGYAQRDILRLAHPKAPDGTYHSLYHWVTKGWEGIGEEPHPEEHLYQIWAFEKAKRAASAKEVAGLVREYGLTREMVPTHYLNEVEVWDALLEKMPMEAMLRNLATMTRIGLLKPLSAATREITKRLGDGELIRKSRLHPIKILAAMTTYGSGHGVRGQQTWIPLGEIVGTLNLAFYEAFGNVEASGKRILLAVDVSGSMHGTQVNGIPNLIAHQGAAAMALITAAREQQYHLMGYDTKYHHLNASPGQRLDTVAAQLDAIGGGGTDCSVPIIWALRNKIEVDTFVSYTDGESWSGNIHVAQALRQYRRQMGIPARAVNVQMAATHTRLSDPDDALSLECIGFDTSTPEIIAQFLAGAF